MLLRPLAAVLRAGLIWMAIWAVTGALLSIVIGLIDPPSIDAGEGPVDFARLLGGVGAGCGLVFGALLVVLERHRTIAEVPLLRAAFWGVVAGALVPLLTSINDRVLVNTCPLGAISGLLYATFARLRATRLKARAS